MGGFVSKIVFQPPPPTYHDSKDLLWLKTRKGDDIPAFFLNWSQQMTILFSHGNAEDLGYFVNYFREVCDVWKANVFAYEYSGYGITAGKPSEDGVYACADAAYDYLTDDLKIHPDNIVIYGRSLGSGPSCYLASTRKCKGLILQSPMMSIFRIAINTRFSLPGDMFCNIDRIKNVKCPVFIVHGMQDEVVPIAHGLELFNAAKFPIKPYWVDNAGHNDLEIAAGNYFFESLARFIKFLDEDNKKQKAKASESDKRIANNSDKSNK